MTDSVIAMVSKTILIEPRWLLLITPASLADEDDFDEDASDEDFSGEDEDRKSVV